ncbi:MAG: hypothetical protein UV97_C0003G0001, partial [Candidatus Yanofskybacteria bacterium GW2011_GWF2_43_596]
AKPIFETLPMRPLISCMAIMKGKVKSDAQSIEYPYFAPAIVYVAMADGSSSEAPVINPAPNNSQTRFSFFIMGIP